MHRAEHLKLVPKTCISGSMGSQPDIPIVDLSHWSLKREKKRERERERKKKREVCLRKLQEVEKQTVLELALEGGVSIVWTGRPKQDHGKGKS